MLIYLDEDTAKTLISILVRYNYQYTNEIIDQIKEGLKDYEK